MSTPPPPPPSPKTKPPPVFAGGEKLGHSNQFTVIRLLGAGGFGEVYLAYEERAERHVAIKVMLPEHNGKPKLLRRFKGEYTLGLRLNHPNLVQMFDLAVTPGGIHYIVMEYVDGVMLSSQMAKAEKSDGQIGLSAALNVGFQLGNVLAQLHERKLIHRDLKASNIMVVKDTTVPGGLRYKLLDFGIAKLTDQATAKALAVEFETTTGAIMGTVNVMGPENFLEQRQQGPEGDVYALSCILYRCIAGNYPFEGENEMAVIMQHITQAPTPLLSEDPSTPPDVASLIHQGLEKNPAARPTMAGITEFFARKIGPSSLTGGQIIVRGGTQELQALIGEISTGPQSVTKGTPVPADRDDEKSVASSPKVTTPKSKAISQTRLVIMAGVLGVATLSAAVAFLARNVQPQSRQAVMNPVRHTEPSTTVRQPPAPDLGVALAVPTNTLATTPETTAGERAVNHQKKGTKKKKNARLVND